jgi:hypothetical protein
MKAWPTFTRWVRVYGDQAILPQNGMKDWMVVDKTLVDLSGATCNKVGVSFSAFRNQPNACTQPAGRRVFLFLGNPAAARLDCPVHSYMVLMARTATLLSLSTYTSTPGPH